MLSNPLFLNANLSFSIDSLSFGVVALSSNIGLSLNIDIPSFDTIFLPFSADVLSFDAGIPSFNTSILSSNVNVLFLSILLSTCALL